MHPIILAGVVLAGVPVLLHLILRQEPKRLPLPTLRFLRQRQRTNQRKLRLRHLLLLAMRVLLIALFALTLFQPVVSGTGVTLGGDAPVAAVFVFDTSPSTGYSAPDKPRLDEARARALALLDGLPPGSRIAVVDTGDATPPEWEPSAGEARKRVEALRVRGAGYPLTRGVAAAYQLFARADSEADPAEGGPLPRLVALFGDRAAASWDAAANDELVRQRDALPGPKPLHLFADVGPDAPANVAILSAEVDPAEVPLGRPAALTVTLRADGADAPNAVLRCELDGGGAPERRPVPLAAGVPATATFTFRDLPAGPHRAAVTLEVADALEFDNARHVTFAVVEGRRILTICDDPADARFWELAHEAQGEFRAEVKTPGEVRGFAGYEGVCLLSVADPARPAADGRPLSLLLAEYVRGGGRLLVVPGPAAGPGYAPDAPGAADLWPGRLLNPVDADPALPWAVDERAERHPLLEPFRDWRLKGNVDFLRSPRKAWRFWKVEAPPENVVCFYDDNPDPAKRATPAVLEKVVRDGRVLMLTTRLDSPWDPSRKWNNYWDTAESSWGVVFPNLLGRYLSKARDAARFQFVTGRGASLRLPPAKPGAPRKFALEGPGVAGADAAPAVGEGQTEWRMAPDKSQTPGQYELKLADGSWRAPFSLNAAAEESDLTKVSPDLLAPVLGPEALVAAGKELAFREGLEGRLDTPLELFPWLLVVVLLLYAAEGYLANRFYRR